ncbi:MAG: PKD-like domain [Bacteroidota bacterium]|jgi:hypothetical protein
MLALLLTLSGFAPLDSLPETVQITGPDTAVGGLPVTLTYCATGLLPNSVSQWNSSIWAFGTGPFPPFNNPGSCQNFNFYLMPPWVPFNPVISCTNTAGSASFSTWIIPMNSAQNFTTEHEFHDSCATTHLEVASTSSWYRADPPNAVLLPHRWQYRDPSTGIWTDFLSYPLTNLPFSAMPTNPAQRVSVTQDTLFGTVVVDSTNYHYGSSKLTFLGSTPSLHGLRVRKVLDRYAGSWVHSDSLVLRSLNPATTLNFTGPDSVFTGDSSLFWVQPVPGATSYTWTVDGGTFWPNPTADSILVRWDSLGTALVTVVSTTAPGCSSSISKSITVSSPPVVLQEDRLAFTIEAPDQVLWSIVPNPSSGRFWITTKPEAINSPLQIFDSAGRLLQTLNLRPEVTEVVLPLGMYYIRDNRGAFVQLVVTP